MWIGLHGTWILALEPELKRNTKLTVGPEDQRSIRFGAVFWDILGHEHTSALCFRGSNGFIFSLKWIKPYPDLSSDIFFPPWQSSFQFLMGFHGDISIFHGDLVRSAMVFQQPFRFNCVPPQVKLDKKARARNGRGDLVVKPTG